MFRRHAIVALLLLGMVMAGVLDTSADSKAKSVNPDESKPVLDTAVEAAMRSRGISPFSASRWEAQGLPQLMEAHDAVTQKLLNVQPRVGDLYSKIPEFKMPDEKMKVPELANDNTVPNPQLVSCSLLDCVHLAAVTLLLVPLRGVSRFQPYIFSLKRQQHFRKRPRFSSFCDFPAFCQL